METIKIQGKDYVMVNERLKAFRADHPEYPLISEIVSLDNNSCIIKASILNENGVVVATGHAQEDRDSTYINKTSYIENCETSAWGRALGNFGYGIDTSVASADEVAMAIAKQQLKSNNEVVEVETHSFSEDELECQECGKPITEKVAKYSKEKYGKVLCFDCQKKVGN